MSYCFNCGTEYEGCSKCNPKIFYWKQYYCSPTCFQKSMTGEIGLMRVQYESKMYALKTYDFKNNKYVTTNDIELTEDDIQAFVLSKDEFKELKNLKPTIKRKPKSDDETLVLGE